MEDFGFVSATRLAVVVVEGEFSVAEQLSLTGEDALHGVVLTIAESAFPVADAVRTTGGE